MIRGAAAKFVLFEHYQNPHRKDGLQSLILAAPVLHLIFICRDAIKIHSIQLLDLMGTNILFDQEELVSDFK
ncbi:MAG: hypothetical protein ACTHKA_25760 [Anaerocolumna jejuensis]